MNNWEAIIILSTKWYTIDINIDAFCLMLSKFLIDLLYFVVLVLNER